MTFDPDYLDPSLIPDGSTTYWFDGPNRYPAVYVEPKWPHTYVLLGGRASISGQNSVEWSCAPLAPASRRHKSRTIADVLLIDYRTSTCGLGHTDCTAISTLRHDRVRTIAVPPFRAARADGTQTPAAARLALLAPALAVHLLAADGLGAEDPQRLALEAEYARIAGQLGADGTIPDTPLIPAWLRKQALG